MTIPNIIAKKKKLEQAEEHLRVARREYHAAIREAVEQNVPQSVIAAALGITRQRVMQIVRSADDG